MVDPIQPLSPERLARLKELTDASRLRVALYPPPKPPRRRRTRQYPSGRPNPPWQPVHHRRHRRG
ncbi:hypothetical protein [Streptomyces graminilatus]|uniref:hypothetical protein n=1 Tax=Streptomyces graminilatus TaxID=1464070 RepID=UPI00099EAFA9|nr:hypothetical protein [Streptomyces graminilatus]